MKSFHISLFARNLISAICTALLLVVAAAVARPPSTANPTPVVLERLSEDERAVADRDGVPLTGRRESVVVVVFQDLECPACRQLQPVLEALSSSPESPSMLFRHYPLPEHRNARRAAIAAECARSHGRFAVFVEETFKAQDSLARVSWPELAAQSGIVDTAGFGNCLNDAHAQNRVDRDIADARQLNVPGTPYILVGRHPVLGVASLDSLNVLLRLEHARMASER